MAGEEEGESWRQEVGPGSPQLLPIPVQAFLLGSCWQGSGERLKGEVGSCPLLCPDLMASLPQAAGPRVPFFFFFWIQDYRARIGPWFLSPLLMAPEIRNFSIIWKWIVLVLEHQSSRNLGACAIKASGDNPPFFLLVSQLVPWPFSKERTFGVNPSLWLIIKSVLTQADATRSFVGCRYLCTKDVQVPGHELNAGNSGVSHTHPCPSQGHSLAARNEAHRVQWTKPTSILPVSQVPRPAVN